MTAAYRPYIATSAINKPIPSPAPIHPDTAKMISAANHWTGTGTWLGPRNRGSYYRGDTSKLPKVTVNANANGWVGAGPFTMPMPSWMAAVQAATPERGDGYVHIVDSVTGDVWELWHAIPPASGSRWTCSAYRHWPGDTLNGKGYGDKVPGTSASKIHLLAGMIVPEDFADLSTGSVIPHALRMDNFCGSSGSAHPKFVAPAAGGDGRQPEGIPCGARVQLDPAVNVDTWPSVAALREPWRSAMRKLLRTMQVYGIVQVDSTGAPGAGNLDCVSPFTVVKGGDTYPVGYRFPNDVAGYGWGLNDGVPEDLMPHFRVIDWTKWAGA